MLYLVSTPLGNLSDITYRAVEILKFSDYILCEDTRQSRILLNHYEIKTPLKSYHQFSEAEKEEPIICDLSNGKQIALISDAGTPGISDPGMRLVKRCRNENIRVIPIPGPTAAIAALSASGLDTAMFQFLGFLPKKEGELKNALIQLLHYSGTTVCYESPHRLEGLLAQLTELAPKRKICIAREITKKFEEFIYGTAEELIQRQAKTPYKGEITLVIEGDSEGKHSQWKMLTPKSHVACLMEEFHLSKKDAIKLAAELRGVPKRDIYREFLH